ncbi:MAG TPA: heme lyase CcmF/NrfE family subunit [Gemmatimonadota bacterium]|nr:heme lyase CcmF/NrfE family subunit [Gemmatimonadota bacterium]
MNVYSLGPPALWTGLVLALYGAVLGHVGGRRRDPRLIGAAVGSVYGTAACVLLAYGLLTAAFLTDEFRLAYVATHTSRAMLPGYKAAAVWGGMEGSMLLWALVLAGYACLAVAIHRRRQPLLVPHAAAILQAILAFFLAVMVFSARPFVMLDFTPADGTGLNPLLQNHWMAAHPPSLYLGYVGWSVPFAFAMAALITGRLGSEWIAAIRKWSLVAFLFLTVGNLMGSHWAYIELGWGGFWGWDPVENSAIMPWFVGAAFIHSIMIQEKRGMLKLWNIALVTAAFALTILGTFVTRSGIIESVHAFASTDIGFVFLGFLTLVVGTAVALTWWRADLLASESRLESFASRESAFLFNNLLLLGIAFAIWWGTFFPFISEAATGQRVSVGAPFFNQVNAPLSVALLLLLGIGPVIAWRRASRRTLERNFRMPLAVLGIAGAAAALLGLHTWYALAVVAFGAFTLATIAQEVWRGTRARMRSKDAGPAAALVGLVAKNRRRYGGYTVHVGVVLVFAGIAGALFVTERSARLVPGAEMSVGPFDVVYRGTDIEQGPNYTATVANLTVAERGGMDRPGEPMRMRPERRFYPAGQEQVTTEVAIWSRPFEDMYAILEGYDATSGAADVTLIVNPMILWIWIGGGIMVLGMLIALSTPRLRVRRGAVAAAPPVAKPAAEPREPARV